MYIPLVDILRCVNPHPETWLVASIERAEARDILEGTLGCPTCLAEYPIRDGVVYFTEPASRAYTRHEAAPSEEAAIRLAAALDLTDARMTAVLHGRWGMYAPLVRGISPAQLLLVNPAVPISSGDGLSIVVSAAAPIAAGAVHAAAFDDDASDAMIASLIAAVRAGGRIAAPATRAVPAGLAEIARDDVLWVARNDAIAPSAPILPTRRSPRT